MVLAADFVSHISLANRKDMAWRSWFAIKVTWTISIADQYEIVGLAVKERKSSQIIG